MVHTIQSVVNFQKLEVYWLNPYCFVLLDIFFIYISNAIPKVPYNSLCPAPLPTHSLFLVLAFLCTGAYKVCNTKGPLFPVMAH